jgi:ATP-dependent Lhr-like helicase
VASNINDLAECAVTARMMAQRQLEPVKIHENPLDVLAQTIVGLAAVGRIGTKESDYEDSVVGGSALCPPVEAQEEHGGHKARPTPDSSTIIARSAVPFIPITADEVFELVRRTYPYRTLDRPTFDRVLRYLRGGGVSLERNYENLFGKVRTDEHGNLTLSYPRVAREFYQNIGTINTESMVQVRLRGRPLGQIEESFMKNIRLGDVFVLNGRTVRLVKAHLLTAHVVAADSSLPTVPRWYANKMPLASGLAEEVVRLRTEVAKRLSSVAESVGRALCPPSGKQTGGRKARPTTTDASDRRTPCRGTEAAIDFLRTEYAFSAANARALADHFALQAKISTIPTAEKFLVEVYREGDYAHYFFHALIGRSANDAVSRIVAQRVQEIKGGNALVSIDDYGFLLSLRSFQTMNEDELKRLFLREGAEDALRQALSEASLVKWQFRGVAQTGLMVPRRSHGVERGARMLQWSSEIIFDVLRKHEPDHPLLVEAYAEATLRFLDLPRALDFFHQVHALPWDVREIPRVSPFSFGIYVSKIKETMTLEDPETTIERLYHEMYGEARTVER